MSREERKKKVEGGEREREIRDDGLDTGDWKADEAERWECCTVCGIGNWGCQKRAKFRIVCAFRKGKVMVIFLLI